MFIRQPLRLDESLPGVGGNLGDLGSSSRVGVESEGPRAHLGLYLPDLAGRDTPLVWIAFPRFQIVGGRVIVFLIWLLKAINRVSRRGK